MSDEMDEIWALYADDGAQALDAMESTLMAIEDAPEAAPTSQVAALFRAVHTFKGNSRVLGLSVVESRAHLAEDLIGLVRDAGVPFDAEIHDILMEVTDTLRVMLEATAATHADVGPEPSAALMDRLANKIARCSGGDAVATDLPEPAAVEAEPAPEQQAAPAVDLTDAFAGLQDLDDAPASQDDLFDVPDEAALAEAPSEAVEVPAVVEPVAVEPEPAPESKPAMRRLFDDPTYRDIFAGMVKDAMAKLHAILQDPAADPQTTRRIVDDLAHAAKQMGLDDWHSAMAAFLSEGAAGRESLAALLLTLDDLSLRDLAKPVVAAEAPKPHGSFFDQLAAPLAIIARAALDHATGETFDADTLQANIALLTNAATSYGFVRVIEACQDLQRADTAAAFGSAEMRLYEELSAVEAVMPDEAALAGVSPRGLLATWAADHIFDTLANLDRVIDALRQGHTEDATYRRFTDLMRLVHHACAPYKIETAAQLAMSLIDLFSRVQTSGAAPDAILTHIARGFIDTLELVFDALSQGETPETAELDKLFEQAANACFSSNGLLTATAIERRLGLPVEFHRVLSPDSVRAASEAIEAGMAFYIVRADINSNETRAEAFLTWISSPQIRAITNVTVFRDAETLFDFLVATHDDETTVAEALAEVDHTGRFVHVQRKMLATSDEDTETAPVAPVATDTAVSGGAGISAEMLETIGEIAASQSMINHMLTDLAEADLAEDLDAAMRAAGHDWATAKTELHSLISEFSARLRAVAQLEAQLVGRMTQLQEETVAIRSRPVESLLRPLAAFVQTLSRRNRRETRFSTAGDDMLLDMTLLDVLRKVLRNLVQTRLEPAEGTPTTMHIAFHRDEEMVMVTLEDDGAALAEGTQLTEIEASLQRASGKLRQVQRPGGGMRFHLTLPLTMVVLEGMVVGVGGIRYVLPVDSIRTILQPSDEALFQISAAQGRSMIRFGQGEVIPVHPLSGHAGKGTHRRVYVVLGTNGQSIAIPVDELVGQQLVLLRPLRGVMARMPNLTGTALLAGGEVGMVLSASSLLSSSEGMVLGMMGAAA
jgi:two-component system chemotaxis sensor kinase CheA